MSERDNTPKPLPDDFGMTMPGIRPNKQQQQNQENLDFTTPNLRLPNQQAQPSAPPPQDDFGMTIPNIQRGGSNRSSGAPRELPPDDFDLPAGHMRRETPSDADFGLTMPGTGGAYGYNSGSRNEPDFGATMPYIKLPEQERRRYEEPPITVPIPPRTEEKRKTGVPAWLWATSAGLAFLALLLVGGIAAWYFLFRTTGFVLVVKNAPPGSSVFVDNVPCGESSLRSNVDGIRCYGLEAGRNRSVKVTHEGFTEHNETVNGTDGKSFEIVASMAPTAKQTSQPQANQCDDPDPRVAQAECLALDELDKLKPPFTADDLVRVLNLQIINFESNKFDIPDKRKTFLRRAAEKFNQLPATTVIEIGGHTDSDGGVQDNMILSQNRANAVRNFLSGAGVNESMMTMKGYGLSQPIAENSTSDGKFKNRRIQYTVIRR